MQYSIRKALALGQLVRIDGHGRHKHAAYRIPGEALENIHRDHAMLSHDKQIHAELPVADTQPHAVPPVADISLPPGRLGPEWRHIEWAEFRWRVHLDRPQLVTWDQRSQGLKNGVRWRSWRYPLLGQVWGTTQLYSNGTAVLHLDKVPVRWADMNAWNTLLYTLAVDAQRRLGQDLAGLGTGVQQTVPDPIENEKAKAARIRGEPHLVTGELVIPVAGAEGARRTQINDTTEFNRTPPGPAVETSSILYGYVADHLPDRVIALEKWNERLDVKLDEVSAKLGKLDKIAADQEKVVDQLTKVASLLERLLQPREPEPMPPAKVEKSKGPGDYVA